MPSEAFFEKGNPRMHTLDTWVMRVGLRNILYALASVCDERAAYAQGRELAKWREARDKIEEFARDLTDMPFVPVSL